MDRKSGADSLSIIRLFIGPALIAVLLLAVSRPLAAEAVPGPAGAASENDTAAILQALLAALSGAGSAEERHGLLLQAAGIEELSGMLPEAQRHYQEAAFALPGSQDLDSLLASAQLLYETGNADGAEAQARAVLAASGAQVPREGAILLTARIQADRGEHGNARTLVDQALDGGMSSPALLLLSVEIALAADEPDALDRSLKLLAERYGESPEYHLARSLTDGTSGPFAFYPAPSRYLNSRNPTPATGSGSDQQAAPVTSATASPAVRDAGTVRDTGAQATVRERTWVQTGSFLKEDNARELVEDLRRNGFSADILIRDVGGKRYFKVVTPTDGGESRLQNLIQRMKEKGYETFLLFE